MEMSQTLINGSIIQLIGATNIDSIRGSNPCSIAYSEFMYLNPNVRDVLSPILAQNGGIEILNGTPNGKGPAYNIFKSARANTAEWCTEYLTVDDTFKEDGITPIISNEQIEIFRQSGMAEEMIQQEFYCSWDSGSVGAYYTKQMSCAELEGRICNFQIHPNLPVFTFWDMGRGDMTSIWFLQPEGDKLRMVYFYETNGEGFEHYAKVLRDVSNKFGFKYAQHFGPHDLQQRQWGATLRSVIKIAAESGINFLLAPNIGIQEGIDAVRHIFPKIWFHSDNCQKGIEAITAYKKEWDSDNRVFKKTPLHDWSSHCADALRYFAVAWSEMYTRPDINSPRKILNKFSYQ